MPANTWNSAAASPLISRSRRKSLLLSGMSSWKTEPQHRHAPVRSVQPEPANRVDRGSQSTSRGHSQGAAMASRRDREGRNLACFSYRNTATLSPKSCSIRASSSSLAATSYSSRQLEDRLAALGDLQVQPGPAGARELAQQPLQAGQPVLGQPVGVRAGCPSCELRSARTEASGRAPKEAHPLAHRLAVAEGGVHRAGDQQRLAAGQRRPGTPVSRLLPTMNSTWPTGPRA